MTCPLARVSCFGGRPGGRGSLGTGTCMGSARCGALAAGGEMLVLTRMQEQHDVRPSRWCFRLDVEELWMERLRGHRETPGAASNVTVVPTADCTNASGMARAIAWTALQPEQWAGRMRPALAARNASTVGSIRAS